MKRTEYSGNGGVPQVLPDGELQELNADDKAMVARRSIVPSQGGTVEELDPSGYPIDTGEKIRD